MKNSKKYIVELRDTCRKVWNNLTIQNKCIDLVQDNYPIIEKEIVLLYSKLISNLDLNRNGSGLANSIFFLKIRISQGKKIYESMSDCAQSYTWSEIENKEDWLQCYFVEFFDWDFSLQRKFEFLRVIAQAETSNEFASISLRSLIIRVEDISEICV